MTRTLASALVWVVLHVLSAASALAQDGDSIPPDVRAELRRVATEAETHANAGRHALAATRYGELYELMRRHNLPRAPIVLWNQGRTLIQVPGREREARDTLQRFLDESTTLTEDPQVRDWRSFAVEHISELEARLRSGGERNEEAAEDQRGGGQRPPQAEPSSSISPVGPIVLAIGGAALVAGVIVGAMSLGLDSALNDECSASVCPTRLRAQYDEMRAFSAAADVMMIAGATTAMLGLVLTLTIHDSGGPTISAACSPAGCGGVIRGRF